MKSGASCVQPTVMGAPLASAFLNRSSWLRQSWVAVRSWPPQPLARAASSSRMVSSHEQAKTRRSLSIAIPPGTRLPEFRISFASRAGPTCAGGVLTSPACPCLLYTGIHPNYDSASGRRTDCGKDLGRRTHTPPGCLCRHAHGAGAQPAATLFAGDAQGGGRRLRACLPHRRRGRGGDAGLGAAVRPRRIRGGARAGGAPRGRAPRLLLRHERPLRRHRRDVPAGTGTAIRVARRASLQRRPDRRRTPRLAGGMLRRRGARLARLLRAW